MRSQLKAPRPKGLRKKKTPARSPFIHIWSPQYPFGDELREERIDGKYGQALAHYLAKRLRHRGYNVAPVSCEEWGWWIEILDQPYPLGFKLNPSSDLPANHQFLIKISMKPGITWSWSELRFVDTHDRVSVLFFSIDEILADDPDVEILGYPGCSPF
jgi:hypothetical protein